jgi:hypothetical protein
VGAPEEDRADQTEKEDRLIMPSRTNQPYIAGLLIGLGLAGHAANAAPRQVQIDTIDVDRFYAVYDAAKGRPTAEALQKDYIDAGSEGLKQFTGLRNLSGVTLAAAIDKKPAIFASARDCAAAMPRIKTRVEVALQKLGDLYPQASFPPVTILIGRGNTGGTTSASGVLIGLETICAVTYMQPDVEDRFVHLIAHEYGHVQQPAAQTEDPNASVLLTSLIEGGAEFLAELTSGSISNIQLQQWTKGREAAFETAFAADMDKSIVDTQWAYHGPGTAEKPGDLAYWVGYRIVKSYYQQSKDKKAAIADIINITDPHAFLAKSGWKPGMTLK